VREKRSLNLTPSTLEQLHQAMADVTTAPTGTAHQAALPPSFIVSASAGQSMS